MADPLMSLVRELKALNARKKAGEALSPDEDRRRKELKRTLKAALESQKGGGGDDDESTSVSSLGSLTGSLSMSGTGSAPKAVPEPKPKPYTPKPNAFALDAGALLNQAAASLEGAPEPEEYATAEVDDPELVEELEAASPAPAPGPKKDYSAAFKLDAGNLFEAALGSDVVAAAAPEKVAGPGSVSGGGARAAKLSAMDFEGWLQETGSGDKGMRNPPKVIEEVASKADQALAETKKRERAVEPEKVVEQLADIFSGSGYTPPEMHLALEQYYGEYVEAEGFAFVEEPEAALELSPIDPREIELFRAGILSDAGDEEPAPVPNGLAFLDDFAALYELGVLPPADQEVQFDVNDPNLLIPGKRKVTVHLLNGQVKRGAIRKLARDDVGFRLEPQGTGRAEDIHIQHCKAIFVHLAGKTPPQVQGPMLTVTFTDRRSVQGVSDDYQPGAPMFSLVPPAGPRTGQFERIIVNASAVKAIR